MNLIKIYYLFLCIGAVLINYTTDFTKPNDILKSIFKILFIILFLLLTKEINKKKEE